MYSKRQIEFHKTYKPATHTDFEFIYSEHTKTFSQRKFIVQLSQYLLLTNTEITALAVINDGICEALSQLFKQMELHQWEQFSKTIFLWNGKKETLLEEQIKAFDLLWQYVKKYQVNADDIRIAHQYPGASLADYLSHANSTVLLSNPWHTIGIKPIVDKKYWYLYDPNYNLRGSYVSERNLIEKLHHKLGPLITIQTSEELSPIINDIELFIEEGGLIILEEVNNWNYIADRINACKEFSKSALGGLLLRDTEGTPPWSSCIVSENDELKHLMIRLLFLFIDCYSDSAKPLLTKSLECVKDTVKTNMIKQLSKANPISHPDKKQKTNTLIEAIQDSIVVKEERKYKRTRQDLNQLKPNLAITKPKPTFFKATTRSSKSNYCLSEVKAKNDGLKF